MTRPVKAELRKLLSTRLWWGMLIGTILLVALNSVPIAVLAGLELDSGGEAFPVTVDTVDGVRAIYGAGYQSGYLLLAVLGTIIGASDYRHRTVTATFLATPARGAVIASKLVAAAIVGIGYAIAVQLATVLLNAPIIMVFGASPRLLDADVLRALALGVLGIAVWCVIGTAVGLLLRNQIAAIVLVLVVVFLLDQLLGLLLSAVDALEPLVPYTLNNASTAIVEGFTGLDLLPWWGGLLLLLGYGAVAAVAAYTVSVRRDVT